MTGGAVIPLQGELELLVMAFELPGLPPMNISDKQHWRRVGQSARSWRQTACVTARSHGPPKKPLRAARLVLTRMSGHRSPDYDNLVISFKPIVDGLRDAKVITDDNMQVIGIPEYRWERRAPKKGRVRVEVYRR